MSTTEKRRILIFKKYSENLKFLRDNKIIDVYLSDTDFYICPICLERFYVDSEN